MFLVPIHAENATEPKEHHLYAVTMQFAISLLNRKLMLAHRRLLSNYCAISRKWNVCSKVRRHCVVPCVVMHGPTHIVHVHGVCVCCAMTERHQQICAATAVFVRRILTHKEYVAKCTHHTVAVAKRSTHTLINSEYNMRAETSISHGQPPNDGLLSERLTEH